ncbi:MAG TPA: hypothetical protein VKA38_01570 [Draconibacterium sp.]|nr:hypothetical protein [Draconibacterium sp.]
MNSKINVIIFLFAVVLFSSCQKETEPRPMPDSRYPTIYKPLTSVEWETRNTAFQKINEYSRLSLNEYGFVDGEIPLNERDSLTKNFVIQKLEFILGKYQSFLGISDTISVDYRNDIRIPVPIFAMMPGNSYSIDYYFEVMEDFKKEDYWSEIKGQFDIQTYLLTQNTIGNENFIGPTVYIIFNAEENKITISGNWFPIVFIPQQEIYFKDDALPVAYQFLLKETGKDFWEQKQTFDAQKTFIRITKGTNIEIHECWYYRVAIPEESYYYYIFIDTQTGELIHSYKRGMYYL